MPSLLQINETVNSGSHGVIAEGIGQSVIEKGWDSAIAYGRWSNASKSKLIKIGSLFDVIEHGLESRVFDNHGLASRNATRALIRKIRVFNPDIIHLHNIHGYYLNYCFLFEYLNSVSTPVVWTVHDCWAFTGHCSHFVSAGCEKWRTGCYDCELIHSYPKSFVDKSRRNYELKKTLFCSNNNLHIVAVSDWLSEQVKQSFFNGKDIRVIKNGIDTKLFKPCYTDNHEKFIILGVASVWTPDKGLFDFIRLREKLDEKEYDIVLVGLSEKQIKELPRGITGIKRTESVHELVQWYNRADVVLSLSKAETFGLTLAEAMACGTPVIVYDNTAQHELVSKDTGYVVENGNIDEVAATIKLFRQRAVEEVNKQREVCRKRAVIEFDKSICFDQYVNLYEEILK